MLCKSASKITVCCCTPIPRYRRPNFSYRNGRFFRTKLKKPERESILAPPIHKTSKLVRPAFKVQLTKKQTLFLSKENIFDFENLSPRCILCIVGVEDVEKYVKTTPNIGC